MTFMYLLRWLVITCVYFDRAQICTQLNAIFFLFCHQTQVNVACIAVVSVFFLTNFFCSFLPLALARIRLDSRSSRLAKRKRKPLLCRLKSMQVGLSVLFPLVGMCARKAALKSLFLQIAPYLHLLASSFNHPSQVCIRTQFGIFQPWSDL